MYTLSYIKKRVKWLTIVIVGLVLAGLTHSCLIHDNNGYPSAVYFPPEGGTKIINGNAPILNLEIVDYKTGETLEYADRHKFLTDSTHIEGPLSLNYQWLEVNSDVNSTLLEITVAPSEDGKKRKFDLVGYIVNEYAEIAIIQKAK